MILMSEILKAREYHRRKRLEELAKKNIPIKITTHKNNIIKQQKVKEKENE